MTDQDEGVEVVLLLERMARLMFKTMRALNKQYVEVASERGESVFQTFTRIIIARLLDDAAGILEMLPFLSPSATRLVIADLSDLARDLLSPTPPLEGHTT